MRAFTIVNLSLWTVLFLAWVPYAMLVGFPDRVSVEVGWILVFAGVLMAAQFGLRVARHRPVLG
jgi:hypothetical protein